MAERKVLQKHLCNIKCEAPDALKTTAWAAPPPREMDEIFSAEDS